MKLLPVLQQEDGSWVDARVLHSELKVGKDFTNWIKGRISKYEFIENDDWKLDSPNLANQKSHGGDRKSKHYSLTLDMAKELSMLENNKIGRIISQKRYKYCSHWQYKRFRVLGSLVRSRFWDCQESVS